MARGIARSTPVALVPQAPAPAPVKLTYVPAVIPSTSSMAPSNIAPISLTSSQSSFTTSEQSPRDPRSDTSGEFNFHLETFKKKTFFLRNLFDAAQTHRNRRRASRFESPATATGSSACNARRSHLHAQLAGLRHAVQGLGVHAVQQLALEGRRGNSRANLRN